MLTQGNIATLPIASQQVVTHAAETPPQQAQVTRAGEDIPTPEAHSSGIITTSVEPVQEQSGDRAQTTHLAFNTPTQPPAAFAPLDGDSRDVVHPTSHVEDPRKATATRSLEQSVHLSPQPGPTSLLPSSYRRQAGAGADVTAHDESDDDTMSIPEETKQEQPVLFLFSPSDQPPPHPTQTDTSHLNSPNPRQPAVAFKLGHRQQVLRAELTPPVGNTAAIPQVTDSSYMEIDSGDSEGTLDTAHANKRAKVDKERSVHIVADDPAPAFPNKNARMPNNSKKRSRSQTKAPAVKHNLRSRGRFISANPDAVPKTTKPPTTGNSRHLKYVIGDNPTVDTLQDWLEAHGYSIGFLSQEADRHFQVNTAIFLARSKTQLTEGLARLIKKLESQGSCIRTQVSSSSSTTAAFPPEQSPPQLNPLMHLQQVQLRQIGTPVLPRIPPKQMHSRSMTQKK